LAIIGLRGKAGHVQTVPVPDWVRCLLDEWMNAAGITGGRLFRRVSSAGKVWGEMVTEKLVWHVVKQRRSAWTSSHRTISDGVALGSVVPQGGDGLRSRGESDAGLA